jgi:hypothetical protein
MLMSWKQGAWMKSNRDDKAVKRKRPTEPEAVKVELYGNNEDEGNDALQKRDAGEKL